MTVLPLFNLAVHMPGCSLLDGKELSLSVLILFYIHSAASPPRGHHHGRESHATGALLLNHLP